MSELLQRQLSDLRREVAEGRNFIIPTSDLLRMLNTETRVFGGRRKEFERRQLVSSAAAYAAFALLAAGGLLLSFARTSDAKRERDRVVAELKAFTRSVDKERAEHAAIAFPRHSAREAYRMMTDLPGEWRLEGITASPGGSAFGQGSVPRETLGHRGGEAQIAAAAQAAKAAGAARRSARLTTAAEPLAGPMPSSSGATP